MIKFLGVIILWTLGATLVTAAALFLYEAYLINQTGGTLASLPVEQLLWVILDFRDYLVYAAIGGALLGLVVIMIPAVIRDNAVRLLFWSVFGAVSGAVSFISVIFLYNVYKLASSGVAADDIPFLRLVTEVMELQQYAPPGAVAGAVLAFASVAISLFRAMHVQSTGPAGYQLNLDDPDRMIRSQRARRADEYLAARDGLDPDLGRP